MAERSPVETAFSAYLGGLAATARALREEASATLERGARQAAELGWSQRRIAAALGRSQPEIKRLLDRSAAADPPPRVPARNEPTPMLDVVLRERRDEVVATAARHGARNVRVFGSVAAGADTPESDVDLLVDIDEGVGLLRLSALQLELEQVLGRAVDVVPERSLRDEVRATVEAIPL